MSTRHSERRLAQSRDEIARLLDRHRVLETMAHQQDSPKKDLLEQLQHKQNVAELEKRLRTMHAADIAYVMESLPPEDRLAVWSQAGLDQAGDVFVEASDAVRRFIVAQVGDDAMLPLLERLDPEDLAYISPSLPEPLAARAYSALEATQRSLFEDTIQYDRQAVGFHMTREWVEVDERQTGGRRAHDSPA